MELLKPLIVSVGLLSGCATADWAQLSDSATTAVALEHGFSEGNVLWGNANWPVITAVKLGVTQGVKLLPEPYCQGGLMGLTVTGFGAAIWNVGVLLGSGPAALPVAGVTIWYFWHDWWQDAKQDCVETGVILADWRNGWNG